MAKKKPNRTVQPPAPPETEESPVTRLSAQLWWASCAVITAAAAFLRLYKLSLKPFHHDEGVNGFFMTRLMREQIYQYNPENYHGPSLYYFAWLTSKVFGLNGNALRLVPVIFGIATVVLVFCLRPYIGDFGALAAGLLLAVSPGAVYLSRYFIHETLFAFFTLAIVVALLRWYRTTSLGYLLLASASAALLFASKETAFISIGVLVIAGICILGLRYFQRTPAQRRKQGLVSWLGTLTDEMFERFGGRVGFLVQVFSAISVFIIVYVAFFSSFFSYQQGVKDSFKAYTFWTKTGNRDHTTNGWYAYFWWLRAAESPIFILGALGAAVAAWFRRNRVALFLALWAWGMTAAYTLIPYKTPWLALNFVVPLALVAGYGLDWLARGPDNRDGQLIATLFLAVAVLFCGYRAVQLNFVHYDDDSYPYVYAHSKRDLLRLVDDIDKFAKRDQGTVSSITITSENYWPLPWYLRDYTHVGYLGRMSPPGNAALLIGSSEQYDELDGMLQGRYTLVGQYELRPGVTLMLFARNNIVQPDEGMIRGLTEP